MDIDRGFDSRRYLDAVASIRSNAGMSASRWVDVEIDLNRLRENAAAICAQVKVPVWAVVKADAYGLGIDAILPVLKDLVEGWCVFTLDEAESARIWERTGKPSLALSLAANENLSRYSAAHVRPAVWDAERATALREAKPVLSVDTGMQRFACPPVQIDAVLAAGKCDEAFTHATSLSNVNRLKELVGSRGLRLHAAGSSMLHEPQARLDAVRPGLALYRGAMRVTAPLIETHDTHGPAGYTGFGASRHGVIIAGYSNGLRPGPCLINGRRSRIIEVGMQSAFVELAPNDRAGDRVVLLGEGVSEADVAAAWRTSPQEVLCRLCGAGNRRYMGS